MATLGAMKTQIARQLGNRADQTAGIAQAISEAVSEYQSRRFRFNQASDTFQTVAGTEYYATPDIPADIAEIDSIRISAGGLKTTVQPVAFAWVEEISTNASSRGRPSKYAWRADQIRLYPIPDAVYTLTIEYVQQIGVPAADGDSNIWTNQAYDLICASATKRVMSRELHDPKATIYEMYEEKALRRLIRESARLSTGDLLGSM
jgi:hypothetical protein